MKQLKQTLMIVMAGCLGMAAYAGQALSFAELRAACTDPGRFHNQRAPQNIQIACKDVQYRYTPSKSGAANLEVNRWISSSVTSDKYDVGASTSEIAMANEVASCPEFVRVREEISLTRELTCADVVASTGSEMDYCLSLINDLRANNPGAVVVVETEDVISFCSKDGRGQRGQD